jgi:acyl carrier protein
MNEQDILVQINQILNRTLADKGLPQVSITAESELLGGDLRIDSLDLAMLVRELEELNGHDPFAGGFIEFRTAGELAKLYIR